MGKLVTTQKGVEKPPPPKDPIAAIYLTAEGKTKVQMRQMPSHEHQQELRLLLGGLLIDLGNALIREGGQ